MHVINSFAHKIFKIKLIFMITISNLVKHIILNLCIKNLNINNKNCIDLIVFLTLTLMHLNQKIIITLVILVLSFTYFYL